MRGMDEKYYRMLLRVEVQKNSLVIENRRSRNLD